MHFAKDVLYDPESKVVKNRLHLDLRADDPAAELRRLVGLGARVLHEQADWMVLAPGWKRLRDYIDVAAAMRRFSRDELMAMARRSDPSLTGEELAQSMQRLRRLDDEIFENLYGFDAAAVRAAFTDWAR